MTPPRFALRLAGVSDVKIIARQRTAMFQEMGRLPDRLLDSYRARCEVRLREMLQSGEYVGWLAALETFPNQVVAGAGVQLRRVLPHPAGESGDEITIAEGRHAIIINVFTEPPWRRRGVATLVLERIIDWARTEHLDRLVLHASDEGRFVYERLGFIPTSEMRFKQRLDKVDPPVAPS